MNNKIHIMEKIIMEKIIKIICIQNIYTNSYDKIYESNYDCKQNL